MNKKRLVKIFECKKIVKTPTTITSPENKISYLLKKRIRFKSQEGYRNGRWTLLEQENFLKSCSTFGNNWKKVFTYLNLDSTNNQNQKLCSD
jgi:hypothetical protein